MLITLKFSIDVYKRQDQKGYHESAPYAKFNDFRTQCMAYIEQAGGQIKYGHSEVGNFTLNGMIDEQNEREFLPVNAEDAADQLMIAKWIIRDVYKRQIVQCTLPTYRQRQTGQQTHNYQVISHCILI